MFSFSTTTTASATTVAPTTATSSEVTATAAPPTTAANSLKMPQTGGCLVTPTPQIPAISYDFEQTQQQSHFTVTTAAATTTATIACGNDPYATYTNNFDLSLLPQDCNNKIATTATITTNIPQTNLIDNIPTTVYNFDTTITNQQQEQQRQSQHLQQDKSNSLAVPDIKIEQTWSSCPSLNTIKQEQIYQSYFPLNTKQNQLIPPPPAYPAHIYPSPQSSPAQSEYNFPPTKYSCSPASSNCYESLSSSRNSLYNSVSSPCPSIDVQTIKQEQLHILPPSPPESRCDTPTPQSNYSTCSSGFDFKSEPFDSDVETFNDLNKPQNSSATEAADHQLLREYLEDKTFQKLHTLKPLALESFIGDLGEVQNIEPVISLALEHAKREADATCAKLQISQDPSAWSTNQVHAWLRSTLQQNKLPIIDGIESKFNENGAELLQLTEDEFIKRIPECGSNLHAHLEIWKLTYSPEYSKSTNQMSQPINMWTNNTMHAYNNGMEEDTEEEDDFLNNTNTSIISLPSLHPATNGQFSHNDNEVINTPTNNGINITNNNTNTSNSNNNNNNNEVNTIMPVKRTGTRTGGSHIHLWQFLKELLAAPHINGTAIRWIDRSKGIFKIEDSVRVAKLWGKRKNRPAMNYDKLSRSIRQYYKKGIMKKTERSQRLVYQFCQPYHM